MLSMLVFYDRNGDVVGTLDHLVQYDAEGNAVGLVDFELHESAGGRMREIADMQRLDAEVPEGIARKVLGHVPEPGEGVKLPSDHPFRLAHETVVGAATWPEWLGEAAHQFTVVWNGRRIGALVHKESGHRRERADIEAAIEARRVATPKGRPVDLRDVLGGPDRPLKLDEKGRNRPRAAAAPRPALPIVAVGKGRASPS